MTFRPSIGPWNSAVGCIGLAIFAFRHQPADGRALAHLDDGREDLKEGGWMLACAMYQAARFHCPALGGGALQPSWNTMIPLTHSRLPCLHSGGSHIARAPKRTSVLALIFLALRMNCEMSSNSASFCYANDGKRYSTDGPTGMKVVADPSDAILDIVFVHGLTGNREKTWTHRNGIFWPRALLPEDFPRARIMTFGYDADVVRFWTMASSNRLQDHGKSLAYAMLDRRAGLSPRPIVFIAHSLGGLVCEEALVLSDKRQDLRSILTNAMGIIFLGTPHGRAYLASWGAKVAKYVNIFRGTNRDILQNLQPGSSDLQRVEEDFQHMIRRDDINLKVYCFYEALKMNDTIGKIVESESAKLAAYDNCSVNADHRNMTKFTGRSDAGYGQVRGILNRWIQDYKSCPPLTPSNAAPKSDVTKDNSQGGTTSYSGPVFNAPISGRYVIPGTQITGGTVNFSFSEGTSNKPE